jgi:hypothetical protein
METLKQTFLEDPTIVYLILAVAELALAWLWWTRRNHKLLLYLLIPPVLAVAAFTVERLVVTDREQIVLNCRDIARKIEAGDIRSAADYLDEQFGGHWLTRQAAILAGQQFVAQNPGRKITITSVKIDPPPANGRANAVAVTIIDLSGGEMSGQTPITWKVHWIKKNNRWVIDEVDYQLGLKL